jgi:hypothetical protein
MYNDESCQDVRVLVRTKQLGVKYIESSFAEGPRSCGLRLQRRGERE